MQQYALEALEQLHYSRKDVSIYMPRSLLEPPFIDLLLNAVIAGKMSQAVLEAMHTHEGLLAPLRDAAGGGLDGEVLTGTVLVWTAAWDSMHKSISISKGHQEAHRALKSAVLGVVRQSAVLLQLRAVSPTKRQRAVRRAQRDGFLMVRRSPIISFCRRHVMCPQMMPS